MQSHLQQPLPLIQVLLSAIMVLVALRPRLPFTVTGPNERYLTNIAADACLQQIALEALDELVPEPPDLALVIRQNPHFRKEIKLVRLEQVPYDTFDFKLGYTHWCRFQSGRAMADYLYNSRRQQWRIGVN